MVHCNCIEVRKKAEECDYDFLFWQIRECESCIAGDGVDDTNHETYQEIRINYVRAYWKRYCQDGLKRPFCFFSRRAN